MFRHYFTPYKKFFLNFSTKRTGMARWNEVKFIHTFQQKRVGLNWSRLVENTTDFAEKWRFAIFNEFCAFLVVEIDECLLERVQQWVFSKRQALAY